VREEDEDAGEDEAEGGERYRGPRSPEVGQAVNIRENDIRRPLSQNVEVSHSLDQMCQDADSHQLKRQIIDPIQDPVEDDYALQKARSRRKVSFAKSKSTNLTILSFLVRS